jgi:signal transduction histidine kinase/TolA-binding protein
MIKRILLVLCFMSVQQVAFNQLSSSTSDSLLKKLERTKVEQKVFLLNQIAQSYLPANPDKGLFYAEKALELANRQRKDDQVAIANVNIGASYFNLYKYEESLNSYHRALAILTKLGKQSQIASVLIKIGMVQCEKNNYSEAQGSYSSAADIYKSIADKPGLASVRNIMGSMAWRQGNYPLSLMFYKDALGIRLGLNNPTDIAASFSNVALSFKEMNLFDSAICYNQKALEIRQESNNPIYIANVLNEMGNVYWKKQDWEKALEYYFRSIKIRYQTGDKIEIANSYVNIGNLYTKLENAEKAKEYYQLALVIYKENNELRKLSNTLMVLGNIQYSTKQYEEALANYNYALRYRENIGEKKDIAATLNNLGKVYGELDQRSKALKYFEQALALRKEINDNNGSIVTLNDLGNFYEGIKDAHKAHDSFEKAYQLATKAEDAYYVSLCARKMAEGLLQKGEENGIIELLSIAVEAGKKIDNPELCKKAYFALYEYYEKHHDYEKALGNYVRYSEIDDNQKSAQNTLKMMSIHQNLELEKKNNEIKGIENEIILLRQKEDLQTLKLRQQKYLLISLLAVMLLVTLTGILFYNRYQIKKKHSHMQEQQYALIEESNSRLQKSEADLTLLNATKDKYFAIIAHDIKNPLSSLLNLSQVIIEKFDTLKTDEVQNFNRMIHESASNLYNLLENLLFWAKNNTHKLRYNPLPMKLLPVTNSIMLIYKLSANQKRITLINEVSDDIEVYADLQMLTSIMRNLVSNALKFTPEGGQVTIKAKDKFSMIQIAVTDTGIGIAPDNIDKLFRLDSHFTTQGTFNETGSGLGLILVKEFVEKNKGKISVSSEPGNGSTFIFTLPTGK